MKDLSQVSSDQFRPVMKRFAATVNVITSANGESRSGATAVCRVPADSPGARVIGNRTNCPHPVISASKAFAINVLAVARESHAMHFASTAPNAFSALVHASGQMGRPVLPDAGAHPECVAVSAIDSGSHTIFVGKIVCELGVEPRAAAL